jgi:hypothetical protein
MARAFLAGLLALPLVLSVLVGPAAAINRVDQDGTSQAVDAPVYMQDVPRSSSAEQGDGNSTGGSPPAPTLDSATIEMEKLRATRTITFYGHVFGSGMTPNTNPDGEFGPSGPQPANTIPPYGDANLGLGFFDWCTDAANAAGVPPVPQPETGCDADPQNKLALFLTAGPVQVHKREDFVYSKLHNEHGRTKDIVLDTTQHAFASMWMSLDAHSWSVGNSQDTTSCPFLHLPPDVGCPYPYWGWDPAFWPQWVVEAKLYMTELGDYGQGASEPPPILQKWASNDVQLIAEGTIGPADVTNGVPGSENAYEYKVDMGIPKVAVIPKTQDVFVVFNFYGMTPAGKVSSNVWRVWAGELFPAKFSLPVKNALDVELVIPQFVHDKLLVHGVISSAFGSYDVSVPSATLTIMDSSNRPVIPTKITHVGDYQVAHGAHFKPVNMTWIWDYKQDKLAAGTYKAIVKACNQQGSACEETTGLFTIDANGDPTDITVGRQGQITVSEGQLQQITGGGEQGSDRMLSLADLELPSIQLLKDGTVARQAPAKSVAPAKVASEGPRSVPSVEGALILGVMVGAALVVRRRWFE